MHQSSQKHRQDSATSSLNTLITNKKREAKCLPFRFRTNRISLHLDVESRLSFVARTVRGDHFEVALPREIAWNL